MQVGVRTLNLLIYYTELQQTKYMYGYVNDNCIGVLPPDLYPQLMCLNTQVCSQYNIQYVLSVHEVLSKCYHPNKWEELYILIFILSMYIYVSFFIVRCMFIVSM